MVCDRPLLAGYRLKHLRLVQVYWRKLDIFNAFYVGGSTIFTELEDAQIVYRQGFLETNCQILHEKDDYASKRARPPSRPALR